MHSNNIQKRNNYFNFFICACTIVIFISCTSNNKKNSCNIQQNNDSLTYLLSDEASDVLDTLVQGHNIKLLFLLSNSDNNEYKFSFSFFEDKLYRGEKAQYILKRSNRYLKTKNNLFKIYIEEDKLFAHAPKNTTNFISHYPGGGIKVNARGELLDSYSESYMLPKLNRK